LLVLNHGGLLPFLASECPTSVPWDSHKKPTMAAGFCGLECGAGVLSEWPTSPPLHVPNGVRVHGME
jgi:hypothetical protein